MNNLVYKRMCTGSCLGCREGEERGDLGWKGHQWHLRNGPECHNKDMLVFEYEEEELSNILISKKSDMTVSER